MERTASNSCSKWIEKEKSLGSGFPVQKTLKGAYNISWSKRGCGYNALSGRGGIIGFMTGKCIDRGIKNKVCKFCSKTKERVKSHLNMTAEKIFLVQQRPRSHRYAKNCLEKKTTQL